MILVCKDGSTGEDHLISSIDNDKRGNFYAYYCGAASRGTLARQITKKQYLYQKEAKTICFQCLQQLGEP